MSKPWILGIASSHNGAVCLLHGEAIAVAVQEERLLRYKRATHPGAYASLAIEYCLNAAGIRAADIEAVGLCASENAQSPDEDVRVNPQLDGLRPDVAVYNVPHHLGHAIAVHAMSGRPEATVLVVDGCGSLWQDLPRDERLAIPAAQIVRAFGGNRAAEVESNRTFNLTEWQPREIVSLYSAERGKLSPLEKHISLDFDNVSKGKASFASLGNMYAAVGLQIFGSFLDGPGKVMGLAPYGQPNIPVEEFFDVADWGLDFRGDALLRFPYNDHWPKHRTEYQNLAASVQSAVEKGLLVLCERLRRRCSNLFVCYTGGVALNSVANERIIREAGFRELFIMPAAEDSGTAIGAAYHALWKTAGYKPTTRQRVDSAGRSYSQEEISKAIHSLAGTRCSTPANLFDTVSNLLADGKIIGWFQDGSELGPRSLGQRSILCDPRAAKMKDILNERVKLREPFRPFAPAILEENVQEWFEVDPAHAESPFMLRVMRFLPKQAIQVPAVAHVDGTGRVQTVSRQFSPRLHALLLAWKKRSGIPILLNTSFNIAGEPIVETPEDAIWCMIYTGIDCCVIGDRLLIKTVTDHDLFDCVLKPTYETFALYDASSQQNNEIEFPDLAITDEVVASAHVSRAEQMAAFWKKDHLRIIVRKPWGTVANGVSPAFVRILELVDGRRTARAIFEMLTSSNGNPDLPPYTLVRFKRHLGMLRRLGAVHFVYAERADPILGAGVLGADARPASGRAARKVRVIH